ncbi:MAG: UPF0158 family protein [Acidimicrobiales bacterium]|nr:UPF0158 family protein [Acidimicrobiales bacterium]
MELDDVDLGSLILARNDTHPDGDWWFDTRTGESLYFGVDDDTDLPALVHDAHVLVPASPQPRTDVDDFFDAADDLGVDDETCAELYQAYKGRGGLRRFRERVAQSTAAEAWSRFTYEREATRAITWLRERGIIDAG